MRKLVFAVILVLVSMSVFGNLYAFIGTQGGEPFSGFGIYDVSNPRKPVEVFRAATELPVVGFLQVVDFIYVFMGDQMFDTEVKIGIVDFSEPTNPEIVKEVPLSQGIYLAATKGDFLFGASWNKGILIVDVSDPLNPKEVTSMQITDFNMWQGVRDLSISGNYAYLAVMDGEGWFPGPKADSTKSGLAVVDISIPSDPKLVSYYRKDDWGSVFADARVHGDYVYCSAGEWGIDVVDVSDPADPKFVARTAIGTTFGSVASENYLYVGTQNSGLKVLDISKPSEPELVGVFFLLGAGVDVVVHEGLLLMAGKSWGSILLDISNPEKPEFLSLLPLTSEGENWAVTLVEVK